MIWMYALITGVILDLIIGDPHSMPHPVRLIGTLIMKGEAFFRKPFEKSEKGLLFGGALFELFIVGITGITAYGVCFAADRTGSFWLSVGVRAILTAYLLAGRSLRDESMLVYRDIKAGDTEKARYHVSMIVGRDTDKLDETGIIKAAVETVAENASDGVIAPLFYLILGGPVLGWIYKAVNTMDSMCGYKNDKYLYFGRAAAKTDDVWNYIPSRIAAFLFVMAAFVTGEDGRSSFRIWRRDRRNHKSPNSAQTESACAGALHIQLAGNAYYFGKLYEKPYIGDAVRPVENEDIRRANKLMFASAFLMLILGTAFRIMLELL